jgi:hypothetical protein
MRKQVLSYGGGVNTAAMCVLVVEGKLPRPDYIVMADTGREATATWDYLSEVIQPYLSTVGLAVQIAPHSLATVDLYSGNGDLLLPVFTDDGAVTAFCSVEWKRRVVRRLLRAEGVTECDVWIGYTLDEIGRVKPSDVLWAANVHPLLDLMLTRRDCLSIVKRAGLPQPPKSACWMCSHRSNEEWRYLRDEYPDDFQRAIELEKEVRARDAGFWLHADRVELAAADLDKPDRRANRDMQCGLGMCFT